MFAGAISVTDFSLHCLMRRLTDDPGPLSASFIAAPNAGPGAGAGITPPPAPMRHLSGRNSSSRRHVTLWASLRCLSSNAEWRKRKWMLREWSRITILFCRENCVSFDGWFVSIGQRVTSLPVMRFKS